MKSSTGFPLRHVSVRVPWHDAGWAGVVCKAPELNGACTKLKRIAEKKRDSDEMPVAGRSLEELSLEQWPCCVDERATFMAPFEMDVIKRHALAARNPKQHGHFRPTSQRYAPYSAGIVPFLWMMRGNIEYYGDLYELDVDEDREPDLGYESNWVHEAQNQASLLDVFAAHLREQDSLCLFYAKHVPFVEGTGRILIGVGRIKNIGTLIEYKRDGEGPRGMVWERPIQHSIRPKGVDGFLMPYYEILKQASKDASLDIERYTARAPDEHWNEFSHAQANWSRMTGRLQHCSRMMETALARIETELGIATGQQRQWLHTELARLWRVRGPFPGLGAVLSALGLSRGVFVAHAIQQKAGENTNPWPVVEQAFSAPASVCSRRSCKRI